eukprot:02306.XXX_51462_51626_1 [CDS] Oithona nana genome sequencing.
MMFVISKWCIHSSWTKTNNFHPMICIFNRMTNGSGKCNDSTFSSRISWHGWPDL